MICPEGGQRKPKTAILDVECGREKNSLGPDKELEKKGGHEWSREGDSRCVMAKRDGGEGSAIGVQKFEKKGKQKKKSFYI